MSRQRGGDENARGPAPGGARAQPLREQRKPRPFRLRRGHLGSHGGGAVAGADSARPLSPAPPRAAAGRAAVSSLLSVGRRRCVC